MDDFKIAASWQAGYSDGWKQVAYDREDHEALAYKDGYEAGQADWENVPDRAEAYVEKRELQNSASQA